MYDTFKIHENKIYTGMRVGGSHNWIYNNGKWIETKIAPDKWKITFDSLKTRLHPAPRNTGASIKTKFHWYIITDQIATKINENTYQTSMSGVKFKVGHKRPHWRSFSYQYPEQIPYKERVMHILEETLKELKRS